MSNNKKTPSLLEYAEIFKALSNPNRLKIFLRLASCCQPGTVRFIDDGNSAYVGDIAGELSVVKSTASHHLKELRRVGLIRTERRGQKIACWVDPEVVAALSRFFAL